MMRRLRQRRRDGDRGAALVEAAFALPVVLMTTLAIMEFGMFFSSTSTTTTSTRDGARYATANYPVRSDKNIAANEIRDVILKDLDALTGQGTPQQLWIYRAAANGNPIGGLSCSTDCFRYTWNPGTGTFTYQAGTSHPWTVVDACSTTASPTLHEVGVMVEVQHKLLTNIIGTAPRTIRERTVLRLEPLPSSQC